MKWYFSSFIFLSINEVEHVLTCFRTISSAALLTRQSGDEVRNKFSCSAAAALEMWPCASWRVEEDPAKESKWPLG